MRNPSLALILVIAIGGSLSCSDDAVGPSEQTFVASISPAGGAAGVDPATPVVLTFSSPMQPGADMSVALHESDLRGPVVSGTRTWSPDRTQLTFTSHASLRAATRYTLHLGGNMRDHAGHLIRYEQCANDHGGQWVTKQMVGKGMMPGGADALGWMHPNGSYGLVFSFTTR